MIAWNDKKSMVSKWFSVAECTYLPSWKCYHIPNNEEQSNIFQMAIKLDQVRELLNKPIKIHCFIRPNIANIPGSIYNKKNYNSFIGGAKNSAHIFGKGVDFDAGEDCDKTRERILPHLEKLKLRMEKLENSNWVHLGNDWKPGMSYYFIP